MARLRRALIAAVVAQGLLGVGALSIAPEPAPGPAPLTLRVVTFNLLHGGIFSELSGDDEHLEERLRLAVRELRALDADVVGLQEASTGRHRGNVAARLADALGYHHVQAPAATRPFGSEHMRRAVASMLGFSEGPALLSRFPIVRWGARELPRCGRPFDVRVLIFAELETSVGRVVAFSTHLSGSECHARALAELVRATAGPLPALVMGDFNATDTAQAIRFLTRSAGFVDAFRLANPATPGFTAGQDVAVSRPTATQRIDYVFLVPGARARARVNGSRVVHGEPSEAGPARWASDHYPVLAEVALELQAPPTLADSRAGRAGGDQQDGGT